MEKERKQQILKAAEKRFARHGLNKTTLEEIARDLRIGKTTIYHYFSSKEELFYAAIKWESDLVLEELAKIFSSEVSSINEKLSLYFEFKEGLDKKYSLIYEVLLKLFYNNEHEKESEPIVYLIKKEEELIKNSILKPNKIENDSLALFIVQQSWGWLFSNKIASISNTEIEILTKEIFIKSIQNMLS